MSTGRPVSAALAVAAMFGGFPRLRLDRRPPPRDAARYADEARERAEAKRARKAARFHAPVR